MDANDDEIIVILCTVPSVEVGETLGRSLVGARLAACVNVVPGLTSVYRWQGEVQVDREAQLLVKTRRALLERASAHIRAEHPYEVPEILALPASGGDPAYLRWITESTSAER
jgi:periplasmic divalent cation tolerance protein